MTRHVVRRAVRRLRDTTGTSVVEAAIITPLLLLLTFSLNVNGAPQNVRRGLRNLTAEKYPADVWNVNNAARNLLEINANDARNDNGDYRIRIYTIGMGDLVRYMLGTMPEKPEDVAPAFQGIQNQILRLSK